MAQQVPDAVPVPEWRFLQDEAIAVLAAQGFPASLTPDFARSAIRAYTFGRLLDIIQTASFDRTPEEQAAYDRLNLAVQKNRYAIASNAVVYWDSIADGDPCWSGGNPDSGIYVPPNVFVSLFCELFQSQKPNQREVYRGQGAAETYIKLLQGNGSVEIVKTLEAMDWFNGGADTEEGALFPHDSEAEENYQQAMNFFRTMRDKKTAGVILSAINPYASVDVIETLLVLGTTVWEVADFSAIGVELESQKDAALAADPNLEDIVTGPVTELMLTFMGSVLAPGAFESYPTTQPCMFNGNYSCLRWPLNEDDPDFTGELYDSLAMPAADTDWYFAVKRQGDSHWQASSELSPFPLTGEGVALWTLPVLGSTDLNGELGGSSTRLQEPLPAGVESTKDLRVPADVGLSTFISDGFLVHAPVDSSGLDSGQWKYGTTLKYKNWRGEWWKALYVNDTFLHLRDGVELPGWAQVAGFVQQDGGDIIQDGTYDDGYTYCKGWTNFVSAAGARSRDATRVDGQCVLLSRDFDASLLNVGDRIEIGGQERLITKKVNCEGTDLDNTGPLVDLFAGQLWCDKGDPGHEPLNPATSNWGRTALIVDPPLTSLKRGGSFGQTGPSEWYTVRKLESVDTCALATTGVPWFHCGTVFYSDRYNPNNLAYCPKFGEAVEGDPNLNPNYQEYLFDDAVWSDQFAPMDCFYSPMLRYQSNSGENWSALLLPPAKAEDDAYSIANDSLEVPYRQGVVMNDNIPSSASITGKSGYRVSLVSDVSHGGLALNEDGSFTYTRGLSTASDPYCGPAGSPYCGPDSFEYEVCADRDGRHDCARAKVDLKVYNEAPRVYDVAFQLQNGSYVASYVYWDPEGDPEVGTTFTWIVEDAASNRVEVNTATNMLQDDASISRVLEVWVTPSASRGSWPSGASSYGSNDNKELNYYVDMECNPDYLDPNDGQSVCVFSPWVSRPYAVDEPFWLVLGTIDPAYKFSTFEKKFEHIVGWTERGSQTFTAVLERNKDVNDDGNSIRATASIWLNGGYGEGTRVWTTSKTFARTPPPAPSVSVVGRASPDAGGVVVCTPDSVAEGGDSTCRATANAGWQFTGWTGDCDQMDPTCALNSVTTQKTATAHFLPRISIGALPPDGGTVYCDPNPVVLGGTAACFASPATGFAFTGWSGECTGLESPCRLESVDTAKSVTANFVEVYPSGDGVTRGGLPWVQVSGDNGWTLTSADDPNHPTLGWIPLDGSTNSPEVPPPPGVEMLYGVLQFTLESGVEGSKAEVTITYPEPLPADMEYWKYNPFTKTWYALDPRFYSVDGKTITLWLTDGGAGDNDLTADGYIVDPGGPAVFRPTVRAIPVVAYLGLLLLAGLMGLLGALRASSR